MRSLSVPLFLALVFLSGRSGIGLSADAASSQECQDFLQLMKAERAGPVRHHIERYKVSSKAVTQHEWESDGYTLSIEEVEGTISGKSLAGSGSKEGAAKLKEAYKMSSISAIIAELGPAQRSGPKGHDYVVAIGSRPPNIRIRIDEDGDFGARGVAGGGYEDCGSWLDFDFPGR